MWYIKRGQLSLYLLKNKYEPVLTLEPIDNSGNWRKASYSNCIKGKPIGDVYVDIDFNGRFDFKVTTDNLGKRFSRSIFFNGDWQIVNDANLNAKKASAGEMDYLFDLDSGNWYKKKEKNRR